MLTGCQKETWPTTNPKPDAEADATRLCFSTAVQSSEASSTKTIIQPDGLNVQWEKNDAVALWAIAEDGSKTLDNQSFSIYGISEGRAWFTTEISQPMPAGTYTYYAAYPIPSSISGNTATFTLPATQDGAASKGSDIMIATPAVHGALGDIPDPEDHSGLSLTFNHLVHFLRFYIPEGKDPFGGEAVERIELTFPKDVCGTVKASLDAPENAQYTASAKIITLDLSTPLSESGLSKKYAGAAIFPTSFEAGQTMSAKFFTRTKVGIMSAIPVGGRTMAAGHSTPVRVVPESVRERFELAFHVVANNLGESAQSVTLSAPEGCKWSDTGSNTYTYSASSITTGSLIRLEFEDEAAYRSLSSQGVTVTYDSEHITISESITMPQMTSGNTTSVDLRMPYLLFEDFSGVESFSSNDDYGFSSTGSKNATSFLDGWTGGRCGASQGLCIRIACRREFFVRYDARVDSAPLRGTIKKPVSLSLSFDYGSNNNFSSLITAGNLGQTVKVGYTTATTAFKSGATDGTYESENSFYIKEYTGAYDSTPNSTAMTIHNAPAGGVVRIAWRTESEQDNSTTNTTSWLYIDNVKVQVAQ